MSIGKPTRVSRDMYHLAIPILALFSGVEQLVSGEIPEAMQAMPAVFQGVWAWTLIVSASLIIMSAAMPDEDVGNWPELAGQLSLGFVTLAYALGVLFYLWGDIPLGIAVVLAVSFAAFQRSWQLMRLIWPTEDSIRQRVITEVQRLAAEQAEESIESARDDQEKRQEET